MKSRSRSVSSLPIGFHEVKNSARTHRQVKAETRERERAVAGREEEEEQETDILHPAMVLNMQQR